MCIRDSHQALHPGGHPGLGVRQADLQIGGGLLVHEHRQLRVIAPGLQMCIRDRGRSNGGNNMLDQKYFEEMEAKIPKGKVRTRFAPSPTGYMHVGNLRTALYTWLIARNAGGTFILRIEDTDQGRLVEGATDVIYRTLAECGLDHDEGPDVGGPVAPYIQSQRRDTYGKYAKLLAEKGHAYYCFCERCV